MSRRPRLLYLGHNLPFPPHEGALIRSYHTVRLLSRVFELSGLYFFRRRALPTEAHRRRAVEAMGRFGSAQAFPIPQEWSRRRMARDHARSVLSGEPYTRYVYEAHAFSTALTALLERRTFDIVHIDSLDLLAYLPRLDHMPCVLAHHNVESALLRRRASQEGTLGRWYLKYQADLIEAAERYWCERMDLNIAVSPDDAAALEEVAPGADVVVIPNGVDTTAFTPSEAEPQGGLIFVGGYSWFPNSDGMEFFARKVLPLIREEEPSVDVRWIGRAPAEAVGRFGHLGVQMLGYVDDIRPEVNHARCVIVPLRVGGGTRLKILDAWALGKAVVSTSQGCEGLAAQHGENILIADDPEAFAQETLRVLRETVLRRTLERGGRETAESRYDWDVLGQTMTKEYRSLMVTGLK